MANDGRLASLYAPGLKRTDNNIGTFSKGERFLD
jgi:hypothetical protein